VTDLHWLHEWAISWRSSYLPTPGLRQRRARSGHRMAERTSRRAWRLPPPPAWGARPRRRRAKCDADICVEAGL